MHRRDILTAVLAGAGGLFAAATAPRRAKAAMDRPVPEKTKVVYHLADLDKVSFVLGNIRNHYIGVGGPDKVTIALVVHGPALKAFKAASAAPDFKHSVGEFSKSGLEMNASATPCGRRRSRSPICCPAFSRPTRVASCASPSCRGRAMSICVRDRVSRKIAAMQKVTEIEAVKNEPKSKARQRCRAFFYFRGCGRRRHAHAASVKSEISRARYSAARWSLGCSSSSGRSRNTAR